MRAGECFDFGVRVGFLKRLFCLGEDGFATLNDDDPGDASFGKRFGYLVADASGYGRVSRGYATCMKVLLPPAVINRVLPLASN